MDTVQAKERYQRAAALYGERKFAESLALLDELHEAFPNNTAVIQARARVLKELEASPSPKAAVPKPMPAAARPTSSMRRYYFFGAGVAVVAVAGCCAFFLWPRQTSEPKPTPPAPIAAPVKAALPQAPQPTAAPQVPEPAAAQPAAAALPAANTNALPAGCKLGAPIVTKKGRWIFRTYDPASLILSDDGGKTWRIIEKPACAQKNMWCYEVIVCPTDDSKMMVGLGGNGDLLGTEDDGLTWRVLLPCYTKVGTDEKQIMTAFWKSSDSKHVLALANAGGLLEVVLESGSYSPLDATGFLKGSFHRYECVDGKHFLHLWGDASPAFTATMSDDDGKSWRESPMEETPWKVEAKIRSQLAALKLGDENGKVITKQENAIMVGEIVVEWAQTFGTDKRIYVQITPTEGFPSDTNTGVFFSDDQGEHWTRVNPAESQEGLAKLFSSDPFVCSSKDGSTKWISIWQLSYDPHRDVIFASCKGVCYRSSSKAEPWVAMN